MKRPASHPCNDCPWRRNALRGWLGPHDAEEWIAIVHADGPIACHQTIPEGFDDVTDVWEVLQQVSEMTTCAGAEIYRANVGKLAIFVASLNRMMADPDRVFSRPDQFIEYHSKGTNGERIYSPAV